MRALFTRAFIALAILAAMASPAAARSRWQRAETPHFIFYSEVGEQSLREAARKLELFDAELRTLRHLPQDVSPNKLEIYLLQSQSRLRDVEPDLGPDVVGFYTSEKGLTAAFATYTNGALTRQEVLFHEYVHHFMFQHLTAAYPAWFVEGFAEYLQTARIETSRIVLGDYAEARLSSIGVDFWPTTDQLLRHPAHMSGEVESLFYAESWAAVHYLYEDDARMAHFVSYVGAIENGADPVDAFQPAFGMTPGIFEQTLRGYVARGRFQLRAAPLPQYDPVIAITDMPEAANDLLLPLARMRGGVRQEEASALAAQVERVAMRFANDPFAQRARVRALLLRGAFADARLALTPFLESAPDDAELNYLMGCSYLDEAEASKSAGAATATARRYFVKAFRSAPNDVPTLFDYVQTYRLGDPMPESAIGVAVRVSNLAPQVMSNVIPTAYLLMQRQRWDEAILLLRRMAYSPHAGDGAERAQNLLTAAMHHQMPSDLEAIDPVAPPAVH